MCGFVGIVQFDGRPIDAGSLEAMRDTLAHRGPDDRGIFLSPAGRGPAVGLGHRRLSIIDLSAAGRQPMATRDGHYVIVYNGEIYNFQALRAQLESLGHTFFSRSDTEVILNGYRQWGEDVVNRLVGMFAFAVWDGPRNRVFAARDPFGIKPLVYYHDPDTVIFASEIKAIAASDAAGLSVDPEAISLYLSLNYIPAPRTVYREVKKLSPGHTLIVDGRGVRTTRYYDLAARIDRGDCAPAYDRACAELKERLTASVKGQLIADVPLAAFLSGGLDSSIITGIMNSFGGQVRTFTIGFGKDHAFDETDYARAVIEKNENVRATIHDLTSDDLFDLIPTVMDGLDEPFADFSVVPTYLVSKKTREQVTVALSGDGADEVFGGYRKYLGEQLYRWWRLIPGPVRRGVIGPIVGSLPQSRGSGLGRAARTAKRFMDGQAPDPADRHFRWLSILPTDIAGGLLTDDFMHHFAGGEAARRIVAGLFSSFDGDIRNRMFYTDVNLVLPDDMLMKVDMMSMMNSLEVRVPFLDPAIVELAFSLPGRFKLSGTRRKKILQDAFADILPKRIINRPKQGFEMPIGQWFKGKLAPLFFDVVTRRAVKDLGVFRYEGVDEIYKMHRNNQCDWTFLLWNIFALVWWDRLRKKKRP
jgi:asparagine synthase (glutamine-hydrolysing)